MDFIGVIIFILFVAFKVFGKMNPGAGPDGTPQKSKRLPPWFPDFDEAFPPVFNVPEEKRRKVPVNRVPGDSQPDIVSPAEPLAAEVAKTTAPAPAPASASATEKTENQSFQEPAAEDIIKGFVWAEILSPPRAKRPFAADCLRR